MKGVVWGKGGKNKWSFQKEGEWLVTRHKEDLVNFLNGQIPNSMGSYSERVINHPNQTFMCVTHIPMC